ncbi:hypothetical protein BLNAU_25257 [Blattamonas nauphoetae]|uniref:Uncharacterized protein n=1 Tax=Blattamonas nauphoetae TaxID=2049346 RepID=A0ABQ9WK37_9EUKA|nr:hypothetical protein BLNAU_25257 [Blattamonas nauphoetae]
MERRCVGCRFLLRKKLMTTIPKAMKGKKAKAKKTEPSPIAPQNSKTSRKGRNRATVEETIDNPFETTTEEAQEVVRRVFTAHFTRLLHSADPASISKTSSSNTLHKGVSTTTQPSLSSHPTSTLLTATILT